MAEVLREVLQDQKFIFLAAIFGGGTIIFIVLLWIFPEWLGVSKGKKKR